MKNKTAREQTSSKNHESAMTPIVIFFTLIGLAIRLAPALQTNFPLNDGGLFYEMILDLQAARYALPDFATYNNADIPFAYPPLAFYLAGLLADLFHIPLLDILRLLPPIISALAIPAFYLLAKEVTDSKLQIVFGIFAFTLLPRVFAWHIMGGGITRSFGFIFALLTMTSAYRFYEGHEMRHLLACILLGALTVLTHPEATVHTAITALVFYLWKDRSLKGILLSLGIAAGILALTSPWWGLVVSRYGIDPFLASMTAAGQDSFNPLVGLFIFFRFLFTEEAFLPILALLGLVGIFASLARKQTLIPGWMLLIHLIEPRGGTQYMMVPLALLIGYALENVILPALHPGKEKINSPGNIQRELERVLGGKTMRYFILFVFAYSLMSAYTTGQNIKDDISLQPADLESFAWVRENTPADSQFLLVTVQHPFRDAWSEWFPVLAERRSQATVFGYEWVNDGQFRERVDAYNDLQACSYQDTACLSEWEQGAQGAFSYVYLWNRGGSSRYPLTIHLQQDANYSLVFQNEQTAIFQRVK